MRILSGLTPSADGVHLGNYFGAIRQWLKLQDEGSHEPYYFIANYHALNTIRTGSTMRENSRLVATEYLALGLNPTSSVLYRQSDIPEVCELMWLLSTVTPMGLLERCHAYKDKVAQGQSPDHGLFAYPVLMAADILLPRANLIPVGEDQKQHVEVTRDIAQKFNHTYCPGASPEQAIFPLPEAHIVRGVGKVPGTDGRKMSKSYGNQIKIFGAAKKVRKSFMGIVTDSAGLEESKEPEGNTIYELYKLLASSDLCQEMAANFRAGGYGYGHAKVALHEAFLAYFGEAHGRYEQLINDPEQVEDILQDGASKVRPLAMETMERVRDAMGLSAKVTLKRGR